MNGAPTLPSDSPQKGNITILINRIPTTYPLVALQKDPFRNQYLSLICRLGSKCKWGITSNKLSNTLSSWGAALVVGCPCTALWRSKRGNLYSHVARPIFVCFPPSNLFSPIMPYHWLPLSTSVDKALSHYYQSIDFNTFIIHANEWKTHRKICIFLPTIQ